MRVTLPVLTKEEQMQDPGALCSPEFAQQEDVKIWLRDWVCVGFGQQIPEPGDLLPAPISSYGLHVQRELEGTLRAAFNYRMYGLVRNAQTLCSPARREINCPQISCPYSRWAVRADAIPGSADATPEISQFAGFNPDRLIAVKVEDWQGLLFVNIGVDGSTTLSEQLGDLGRRIVPYRFGELVLVSRFWFDLDCNWKLAGAAVVEALGGSTDRRAWTMGPDGPWVPPLSREELIGDGPIPALGMGHAEAWSRRPAGDLLPLTPCGTDEGSRCYLVFPNLMLAFLPTHAVAVVVKPTYFDTSIALAGIFVPPETAARPDLEPAVAELTGLWRQIASDAVERSGQWDMERAPVPEWPILEMAFDRVAGA